MWQHDMSEDNVLLSLVISGVARFKVTGVESELTGRHRRPALRIGD